MTKIKICGLTREEDILAANEAAPDYIGFVFAPGRRRTVTAEHAAHLKSMLSPEISVVGVFVNEDPETVISLANNKTIDLIQLHGDEDEAYIGYISEYTGNVPIIKALSVTDDALLSRMEACPHVDYLLFDNYKPGIVGGTGEAFNWDELTETSKPFFLAGGLNMNNISGALTLGAYALDVSSGAETDGLKDRNKMISLVNIIRRGSV